MIKYISGVVLLILSISCTNQPDSIVKDNASTNEEVAIGVTEIEEGAIELNKNFRLINLANAENIGEFYDHRLRFFEIKKPDITFYKTPVDELVLYFIDSTLVKLRYEIREDVGSYLLDSLGMSKFKPLDSLSRALIAQRQVYNKVTSRLNPELENYELIWRDNSSVKKYKVKNYGDSLKKHYFYHEMYGFDKKIKELEVLYYYLEQAAPILD